MTFNIRFGIFMDLINKKDICHKKVKKVTRTHKNLFLTCLINDLQRSIAHSSYLWVYKTKGKTPDFDIFFIFMTSTSFNKFSNFIRVILSVFFSNILCKLNVTYHTITHNKPLFHRKGGLSICKKLLVLPSQKNNIIPIYGQLVKDNANLISCICYIL